MLSAGKKYGRTYRRNWRPSVVKKPAVTNATDYQHGPGTGTYDNIPARCHAVHQLNTQATDALSLTHIADVTNVAMLCFDPGFCPFLVKRLYTQSRNQTLVRQFQLSNRTLKLSAVSIETMLILRTRFQSVRPVFGS